MEEDEAEGDEDEDENENIEEDKEDDECEVKNVMQKKKLNATSHSQDGRKLAICVGNSLTVKAFGNVLTV